MADSFADIPCRLWEGSKTAGGYGRKKVNGRYFYVHRLAWEAVHGPIPEGYEIDHLCRVTACYEPNHLEAVTHAENMRRYGLATTHCKNGHEFTPENTGLHSTNGAKVCKRCARDRNREWMRRYRDRARRAQ